MRLQHENSLKGMMPSSVKQVTVTFSEGKLKQNVVWNVLLILNTVHRMKIIYLYMYIAERGVFVGKIFLLLTITALCTYVALDIFITFEANAKQQKNFSLLEIVPLALSSISLYFSRSMKRQ